METRGFLVGDARRMEENSSEEQFEFKYRFGMKPMITVTMSSFEFVFPTCGIS
jgi:hypothetical protein